MKSIADKAISYMLKPNQKYKKFYDTLDRMIAVLDQTSMILNALASLPNIIYEMAAMP